MYQEGQGHQFKITAEQFGIKGGVVLKVVQ